MRLHCAPACGSCYNLTLESRCPIDPNEPDAWKPGDLNAMFERLTTEPYRSQYQVQVLSSPDTGEEDDDDNDGGPWVITMENVVTAEEALRLIELGTSAAVFS